jgi:hypothetical protein
VFDQQHSDAFSMPVVVDEKSNVSGLVRGAFNAADADDLAIA